MGAFGCPMPHGFSARSRIYETFGIRLWFGDVHRNRHLIGERLPEMLSHAVDYESIEYH